MGDDPLQLLGELRHPVRGVRGLTGEDLVDGGEVGRRDLVVEIARHRRWSRHRAAEEDILEAGEEGLPTERDRMTVRELYSAAYTALYVNKAA